MTKKMIAMIALVLSFVIGGMVLAVPADSSDAVGVDSQADTETIPSAELGLHAAVESKDSFELLKTMVGLLPKEVTDSDPTLKYIVSSESTFDGFMEKQGVPNIDGFQSDVWARALGTDNADGSFTSEVQFYSEIDVATSGTDAISDLMVFTALDAVVDTVSEDEGTLSLHTSFGISYKDVNGEYGMSVSDLELFVGFSPEENSLADLSFSFLLEQTYYDGAVAADGTVTFTPYEKNGIAKEFGMLIPFDRAAIDDFIDNGMEDILDEIEDNMVPNRYNFVLFYDFSINGLLSLLDERGIYISEAEAESFITNAKDKFAKLEGYLGKKVDLYSVSGKGVVNPEVRDNVRAALADTVPDASMVGTMLDIDGEYCFECFFRDGTANDVVKISDYYGLDPGSDAFRGKEIVWKSPICEVGNLYYQINPDTGEAVVVNAIRESEVVLSSSVEIGDATYKVTDVFLIGLDLTKVSIPYADDHRMSVNIVMCKIGTLNMDARSVNGTVNTALFAVDVDKLELYCEDPVYEEYEHGEYEAPVVVKRNDFVFTNVGSVVCTGWVSIYDRFETEGEVFPGQMCKYQGMYYGFEYDHGILGVSGLNAYAENVLLPELIVYGGEEYPVFSVNLYNDTVAKKVTVKGDYRFHITNSSVKELVLDTADGINIFGSVTSCDSLNTVKVLSAVDYFGVTFRGCSEISNVSFEKSVTSFRSNFGPLGLLEEMVFKADVGNLQLSGLTAIKSLKVGGDVDFLRISECRKLSTIDVSGSVGHMDISQCPSMTKISVGGDLESFYGAVAPRDRIDQTTLEVTGTINVLGTFSFHSSCIDHIVAKSIGLIEDEAFVNSDVDIGEILKVTENCESSAFDTRKSGSVYDGIGSGKIHITEKDKDGITWAVYLCKRDGVDALGIAGMKGFTSGDLMIPSTLNLDGKEYPVKSIGEEIYYFKDSDGWIDRTEFSVKKFVIPESVSYISQVYRILDDNPVEVLEVLSESYKALEMSGFKTIVSADGTELVDIIRDPKAKTLIIPKDVTSATWESMVGLHLDVLNTGNLSNINTYLEVKRLVIGPGLEEFDNIGISGVTEVSIDGNERFFICEGVVYALEDSRYGRPITPEMSLVYYPSDMNSGGTYAVPLKVMHNDVEYFVKTIGPGAFTECRLSTLVLPESVDRIEYYAFQDSQMTEIVLPNTLEQFNISCLENCRMDLLIHSADNVSITTSDYCVYFENGIDGKGVREMHGNLGKSIKTHDGIFSGPNLDIKYGTVNAEVFAHYLNDFEYVILPETMEKFELYGYDDSVLRKIIMPENAEIDNSIPFLARTYETSDMYSIAFDYSEDGQSVVMKMIALSGAVSDLRVTIDGTTYMPEIKKSEVDRIYYVPVEVPLSIMFPEGGVKSMIDVEFTVQKCTATLDYGIEGVTADMITENRGTYVNLPTDDDCGIFVKNKKLAGWTTLADPGEATDDILKQVVLTEDITLRAVWKDAPKNYVTVTLIDGDTKVVKEVKKNSPFGLRELPEKQDMKTVGWVCDHRVYNSILDVGTEDMTLTATYRPMTAPVTVTVILDESKGSISSSTPLEPGSYLITGNSIICLPAVEPAPGYEFDGWESDGILVEHVQWVKGDMTFTARFSEELPPGAEINPDGSYTVTEEYADGSYTKTTTLEKDGVETVRAETFDKDGLLIWSENCTSYKTVDGYDMILVEYVSIQDGSEIIIDYISILKDDYRMSIDRFYEPGNDTRVELSLDYLPYADFDGTLTIGEAALSDLLSFFDENNKQGWNVDAVSFGYVGKDVGAITIEPGVSIERLLAMDCDCILYFGPLYIDLDSEVLLKMADGFTVEAGTNDALRLNEAQKETIGDKEFLYAEITQEGKVIHELGGKANILFFCDRDATMYHVNLDGSTEPVEAEYDAEMEAIMMEVTYLSVFMIGDVAPELQSIEISGDYKTSYEKGDDLDTDGMKVTAVYSDGSTADVTDDCRFSPSEFNTVGSVTVTVSYMDKTATFRVTVEDDDDDYVPSTPPSDPTTPPNKEEDDDEKGEDGDKVPNVPGIDDDEEKEDNTIVNPDVKEETTENEDGSTTTNKTETGKTEDGKDVEIKTETTVDKDGNKVEKKEETVKDVNGTETKTESETIKNKDGQITQNTTTVKTDASGKKETVEKNVVTEVNSKGETTVTAKETVKDHSGNITEVKEVESTVTKDKDGKTTEKATVTVKDGDSEVKEVQEVEKSTHTDKEGNTTETNNVMVMDKEGNINSKSESTVVTNKDGSTTENTLVSQIEDGKVTESKEVVKTTEKKDTGAVVEISTETVKAADGTIKEKTETENSKTEEKDENGKLIKTETENKVTIVNDEKGDASHTVKVDTVKVEDSEKNETVQTTEVKTADNQVLKTETVKETTNKDKDGKHLDTIKEVNSKEKTGAGNDMTTNTVVKTDAAGKSTETTVKESVSQDGIKTMSKVQKETGKEDVAESTTVMEADTDGDGGMKLDDTSIETAVTQMNEVNGDQEAKKVIKVVTATKDNDRAAVSMTPKSMSLISESGADLEVEGEVGKVSIGSDIASNLSSKGGDVSVSISVADKGTMNNAQRDRVGNSKVFELSASAGETSVSQLGGVATITVPYTLKEGQDPEHIIVYFVDDDGNLFSRTTSYDADTKTVTFETEHFSFYMIGTESDAAAAEEESDSGVALYAGIAAVVLVIVVIAVVVRKRA